MGGFEQPCHEASDVDRVPKTQNSLWLPGLKQLPWSQRPLYYVQHYLSVNGFSCLHVRLHASGGVPQTLSCVSSQLF